MKIVSPMLKSVELILGVQNIAEAASQYRFIKYCVYLKVDAGMLIHNIVTKELLFLNNLEIYNLNLEENQQLKKFYKKDNYSSSKIFEELIKRWFIVPLDFDDKSFSDTFKQTIQDYLSPKSLTNYTIFVFLIVYYLYS